jgi:Uncharacterised protein family (UPF0203)
MGSLQSKTTSDPSENNVDQVEGMSKDERKRSAADSTVCTTNTEHERSGMELVNYQCRRDKRAYNKCVKKWYTKGFMTGNTESLHQADACGDLFDTYRTCVLRGIRREFWDKQGLPPPDENSPLAEVDDEQLVEPTK